MLLKNKLLNENSNKNQIFVVRVYSIVLAHSEKKIGFLDMISKEPNDYTDGLSRPTSLAYDS